MGSAVRLPTVFHDPIKAMIAVVNVRDETSQVSGHVPSDTVLDVLIALGLGKTVRVISLATNEHSWHRRTDPFICRWQALTGQAPSTGREPGR